MRASTLLVIGLIVAGGPAVASGQSQTEVMWNDLSVVAEKVVSLAQAIPEDVYDWRPTEGVRSVSEALMHVAGGNFGILYRTGADIPADTPEAWYRDPHSVTDKATVIQALNASFAFARSVFQSASDEDLWADAPRAREGTSMLSVLMLAQTHAHEHLGQLIAYARTNGVAPPWSR